MKVDRELVLHIAGLARIELEETEIEQFTTQLSSILSYVEKLKEVTDEAEPFSFSKFLTLPMREDVVVPSLPVDRVMRNAPESKKNLFRVPRIIP
jgi:aspartyl-tRNA(Asn)/glutamyl-tRNA(Gln) amidotransferase subunit C